MINKFRVLFLFTLLLISTISVSAAIKSYKVNPGSVTFTLDKGLMKISVCKDDIIEVKYTILNDFLNKPSLIINNQWHYPAFGFSQNKSEYIITTKKLKVKIDKATNAITYNDLNGKVITSEDSENKTMSAATIAGINTYNVST